MQNIGKQGVRWETYLGKNDVDKLAIILKREFASSQNIIFIGNRQPFIRIEVIQIKKL